MFDIGIPEMLVIAVAAMFLFGPDRLPGLAKQAGTFVRTARQMIDNAKNDLADEMGDDFEGLKDLNLRDLSPRELVRRHLLDEGDEPDGVGSGRRRSGQKPLREGEPAPYDADAT